MDMQNKKLQQIRYNDSLIYELVNSPYFKIAKNGTIWSKIGFGGEVTEKWRRVCSTASDGYKYIHFKYKKLNIARIVFCKYGNCVLIAEKVINHIDGNKSNNSIGNLELVTYSENNKHRYRVLEGRKIKEKPENLGRSGQIQAPNDDLIRELIESPLYEIRKDGTILTLIEETGKVSTRGNWRDSGYHGKNKNKKHYHKISYKNRHLSRSRIIYAKFVGELAIDLVVNHIDGNTLNDKPNNLELITQSENVKHTYKKLKQIPIAGNRKINHEIAEEIRQLSKKGWKNKELREKFKLSKSTISYVINNRIWNKEVVLS